MNRMHDRGRAALFSSAAIFGLALASPAAAAQDPTQQAAPQQTAPQNGSGNSSEQIIITAQKRASTVQDTPFSVNAQTQADIQRANESTLEDISRNVAGLAVQNLGPGQSQV